MPKKPQKSLSNSLLIADPFLLEGVFDRAVIHLSEHTDSEGAIGYIMNKPTHKTVGNVLQAPEFSSLAQIPIYFGGPVGLDHLVFSVYWWSLDNDFKCKTRISSEEAVGRMRQHGAYVVAHVGYSSWESGQLEDELSDQVWITTKIPSSDMLFSPENLWEEALAKISPYHELLSITPKKIGLN